MLKANLLEYKGSEKVELKRNLLANSTCHLRWDFILTARF